MKESAEGILVSQLPLQLKWTKELKECSHLSGWLSGKSSSIVLGPNCVSAAQFPKIMMTHKQTLQHATGTALWTLPNSYWSLIPDKSSLKTAVQWIQYHCSMSWRWLNNITPCFPASPAVIACFLSIESMRLRLWILAEKVINVPGHIRPYGAALVNLKSTRWHKLIEWNRYSASVVRHVSGPMRV